MKKEIKNIEASVKAQLQNKAKETNRPFCLRNLKAHLLK